jgi:hypothetical protein
MTEKREVIRRLRLGHSIRHINKSTGMHRTLIRRLKDLAQQHLWLESEEPVPDEATIKALLDPPASSSNAEHPLDPYRSDIAKWLTEEYSYVVIHQLLSPMVPVSESTVRRYCQKHFPQGEGAGVASHIKLNKPRNQHRKSQKQFNNLSICLGRYLPLPT